jgi:hypothetical protein
VLIPVGARRAGDHGPALPRRRGPDLAGLAAFTLDSRGRVASWPVSAERLFGHAAAAVTGRHVCDVLMTGPGQREMAGDALAEVAAGRVWTATMSMAFAGGSGPVAIRWEPLGAPDAGVLVIGQHVSPAIGPGWLREAADRIGTTLDLRRTAREVAEVAVPAFADVTAIFVFERLLAADEPVSPQAGHGTVMRRLVTRLAGQTAAVTDSLLRPGEVIVFGDDSPSFQAMHTRSPVLFDRLDDESAERISRRPGGHELASRAAVCIDNARLYHRERRTAFALQRGLLPGEPLVPAAMEVAHRYLPVGASMVGGDWHDIVALPGGRALFVVGDAMGHGPEAAAVMVQLRTATHLLAGLDLPPGEILAGLDMLAAGMPASPYATCVCAVIDTLASTGVIAAAGHPPPVLALPGGATEVLSVPAGLPLGLGAGTFEAAEVSLPSGATLALYTDGLAESRTRPLEEGIAALRDALGSALAQPGASLDSASETVTQALRQRGEDDITLVLARIRP